MSKYNFTNFENLIDERWTQNLRRTHFYCFSKAQWEGKADSTITTTTPRTVKHKAYAVNTSNGYDIHQKGFNTPNGSNISSRLVQTVMATPLAGFVLENNVISCSRVVKPKHFPNLDIWEAGRKAYAYFPK